MASISGRSKGFPIFFKVITDSTSDTTLIPPEFIRRFGHSLPNRIFLKLPYGRKLTEVEFNRVNGQTLMHRGWPEFKQRLSLQFGHFLVFEYDGKSQFNVRICDTSAVEISYPLESDHESDVLLEDLPTARKRKVKVEDQVNDVIVIPDDKSTVKKSRFQTQNLSSCYKKDSKTESSYLNTCSQRTADCRVKCDNYPVKKHTSCNKKGPKTESVYPNTPSQRPADCRVKRDESTDHYDHYSVTATVYQRAVAFASRLNPQKTPFVIRLMQKSHVSYGFILRMPFSFAGQSLLSVGANAVTMVTRRKNWSVRCLVDDRCVRLSGGWRGFVKDNELKLGDVCIFQVANKSNTQQQQQQPPVWNVIIFRT